MSLEQEFEKRKQEVMKNVVSAVTMKTWYDQQMTGITIPTFLVDKRELQYRASMIAERVVSDLIETNTLEQAFEESWSAIAEILP